MNRSKRKSLLHSKNLKKKKKKLERCEKKRKEPKPQHTPDMPLIAHIISTNTPTCNIDLSVAKRKHMQRATI